MAKVNITTLGNLDNPSSVVGTINQNFTAIQTVIDTLLSRDGAVPNSMLAQLDMNNRRVLNLPVPVSPTEPARHGDIQQYVDQAENAADFADDRAEFADQRANDADASAIAAANSLNDLLSRYIGPYPNDPVTNPDGSDLIEGALYFNTQDNIFKVFTVLFVDGDPEVVVSFWQDLPVNLLQTMADVEVDNIQNNQIIRWNTGQGVYLPATLEAGIVLFDDTTTQLNASDVQEALEDLVARTSLAAYDISFWAQGQINESEQLFRIVAVREFVIPVSLPGARATARVGPVDPVTLTLRRNGTQIGTIFFDSNETEGVFTVPGTVVFSPGDVLEVAAPAVSDTAIRDVAFTITARR